MQMETGSLVRRDFYAIPPQDTLGLGHYNNLPSEGVFELIDLLESIDQADEVWTMAEIGAGHGRWVVAGAVAVRRARKIPFKLIAAEAENSHFAMMLDHFADKGLDAQEHRLIKGAVAGKSGAVYFTQGHSREWYGQSMLPARDYGFGNWPEVQVSEVQAYTLETILGQIRMIDLVDMDIQGAEADVIEISQGVLTRKVKRLHIGTHSSDIEARIRSIMSDMGWTKTWDFPCASEQDTEYGMVKFVDGVQGWINPAFR